MNWTPLTTEEQLQDMKNSTGFQLIFKHSTRCAISMMARKRFELEWDVIPETTPLYFLDLIKYRTLSNQIATLFQVQHESPQLLIIKDGQCVLEQSHADISATEAADELTR
ncbi:MAG: bacillithiol system redox-active protein YtxJ [Sphingobacteriaceae bacterium]